MSERIIGESERVTVESERITVEEVAHVARLARLHFSDDELQRLTSELAAVLDHASDVEALNVSEIEPTSHPLPLINVTRPDEVRPSLDRHEVLSQAPSVDDDRFRVPPILGDSP